MGQAGLIASIALLSINKQSQQRFPSHPPHVISSLDSITLSLSQLINIKHISGHPMPNFPRITFPIHLCFASSHVLAPNPLTHSLLLAFNIAVNIPTCQERIYSRKNLEPQHQYYIASHFSHLRLPSTRKQILCHPGDCLRCVLRTDVVHADKCRIQRPSL